MKATDIRIDDVVFTFAEFAYRTPIKFGGVVLDRATILDVEISVSTRSGKMAKGFGSMPLGNVWAYPTRTMSYDDTLRAMKVVAEQVACTLRVCKEMGHPIDLTMALEPEYAKAAGAVTAGLHLIEPIPLLATLVSASPFDAALHDAFGKVHGLNCYHAYGPDFMNHDLGFFLGKDFANEHLDQYVRGEPQATMPLYHLVGALDALEDSDVTNRLADGLPNTLGEWIHFDGLTHLKIKLNGDNLDWDVDRVVRVDRVAQKAQAQRGVQTWHYSLDFNEKCQNVAYLLAFLERVRALTPTGFDRIQYIEQPTHRDLKKHRDNVMHAAAKRRPIVIDESLLDLESLLTAREMGYTGAALKACKGQSQSLLMAAAAQKFGMFLCVQDLTCPGASLIQSASLAAHVPGVAAIESNARQYCPQANKPWEARFPGIFKIKDGMMQTGVLTGPGLGAM